jgi:hypothetical protein
MAVKADLRIAVRLRALSMRYIGPTFIATSNRTTSSFPQMAACDLSISTLRLENFPLPIFPVRRVIWLRNFFKDRRSVKRPIFICYSLSKGRRRLSLRRNRAARETTLRQICGNVALAARSRRMAGRSSGQGFGRRSGAAFGDVIEFACDLKHGARLAKPALMPGTSIYERNR